MMHLRGEYEKASYPECDIKSKGVWTLNEESKKTKKIPLLLNQNPQKRGVSPLPYQYGADTYEIYSNVKNPFLSRILASEAEPLNLEPKKAQALFQRLYDKYQISFPTNFSPYSRRKVAVDEKIGDPKKAEFVEPQTLKENEQKLYNFIKIFFDSVLERLKDDPYSLPWVVNELIALFMEQQIKIKIYDAYRQFQNWDAFMNSLEQISQDYELENFELFCSALFGFYSQLQ